MFEPLSEQEAGPPMLALRDAAPYFLVAMAIAWLVMTLTSLIAH